MLGDPVIGKAFFNREKEISLLLRRVSLFKSEEKRNLAIIGLRKTGKTSLILEFFSRIKDENILPIYVYCLEKNKEKFVEKLIGGAFVRLAHKKGMDFKGDLVPAIRDFAKMAPESTVLALDILDKLNTDFNDAFDKSLIFLEKFSVETGFKLLVALDEFQRLLDYNIVSVLDKFREKIMFQKNVLYMIAGSAVSMMNKIVSSSSSPLYNHFEILKISSFEYGSARNMLLSKLKGLTIPESSLNFLIDLTRGHPFYLDILSFRIKDLAKERKYAQVSKPLLIESVTQEVYRSGGAIYSYFDSFINETLEKRGFGTFIKILLAIAKSKNTGSEISKETNIPQTSLPRLLRKLIESDLIVKENKTYQLVDKLLEFWLKNVYELKEVSYIQDMTQQLNIFKDRVSQIIEHFKTQLGIARESQIREMFAALGTYVDVRRGAINHEDFDLICRSKKGKGLILGEIKASNLTLKDVQKFLNKCNKVKDVKEKHIFALMGVEEKAEIRANQEKIKIWRLKEINSTLRKLGLREIVV